MFWLGGLTPISLFPGGVRDFYLTQGIVRRHNCAFQMAFTSVERFRQDERRTVVKITNRLDRLDR